MGYIIMKLNFYLECAGLIIGIILWCGCSMKYGILDMKDRIYMNMIRSSTVVAVCNLFACVMIRKNWLSFRLAAGIIVCIAFLYMVSILMYLNIYIKECIDNNNAIATKDYVLLGIPSFVNALLLLVNCGTQYVFGLTQMEGNMQVVFNSWYKIPYLLVIISIIIYLFLMFKGRNILLAKKQYEIFLIPLILVIVYYIQYRFKSVLVINFGVSIVLLLLYVFAYGTVLRRDDLTHMPELYGFEKMLAYRSGLQQNMMVVVLTILDWDKKQQEYGYEKTNHFLKHIARYLMRNTAPNAIARRNHQFYIILENEDFEHQERWLEEVAKRFEHDWMTHHTKAGFSIRIDKMECKDNEYQTQDIMNWIIGGQDGI